MDVIHPLEHFVSDVTKQFYVARWPVQTSYHLRGNRKAPTASQLALVVTDAGNQVHCGLVHQTRDRVRVPPSVFGVHRDQGGPVPNPVDSSHQLAISSEKVPVVNRNSSVLRLVRVEVNVFSFGKFDVVFSKKLFDSQHNVYK